MAASTVEADVASTYWLARMRVFASAHLLASYPSVAGTCLLARRLVARHQRDFRLVIRRAKNSAIGGNRRSFELLHSLEVGRR